MKKLHLWLIATGLFLAINCHQPLPPELQNKPPDVPEILFPENGAVKLPTSLTLRWKVSDPNQFDTLFCDVYLGKSEAGMNLIQERLRADTLKLTSLEFNTQYFWRIVVYDHKNLKTEGPIWTFQTRVEHNNAPRTPDNPHPENHEQNVSFYNANFSWRGGDPDSFSMVLYDFYFGTSSDSLKLLKEQLQDTMFTLDLLLFDTKYFWQIKAKDEYDSVSVGPIWDFTTETGDLKFWEPFDAYPTDQKPPIPPWTVAELNSKVFISETESHNGSGKSICFIDSTESGYALVAARFESITKGLISFYWKIEGDQDFLGMRLYSGQPDSVHLGPQISIRGDKMQFFSQNAVWQDIVSVNPAKWYFVQILFSCEDKIFHVYVNNELKVTDGSWTGVEVSFIDSIYFMTFQNRVCQRGHVDEIKVKSK